MRDSKKPPVLKVLLIVWLVFATSYVFYGEYKHLTSFVAQNAYNQGIQDSVTQLLTEAAKCQPVPVSVADKHVDLISMDCLKATEKPATK